MKRSTVSRFAPPITFDAREAPATVDRAPPANDPVYAPGTSVQAPESCADRAPRHVQRSARTAAMVWDCITIDRANQLLEEWGRGKRFVRAPRLGVRVRRAGIAVAVALFGQASESDAHTVQLIDVHVGTGQAVTAALLRILQGVRAQGFTRVVTSRAVAGVMGEHLEDFGFAMNREGSMEGVLRGERLFSRL